MTERRATAIRRSPQSQLDTSAFEKAVKVEADLIGHEKLCSERYKNLDEKVSEVKTEIRELNDDAKRAINKLGETQEGHHRSNTDHVAKLEAILVTLAGEKNGMQGVWRVTATVAPILISAATLALLIWGHHP